MIKKLMLGAAIGALTLSGAMAAPAAEKNSTPPAASQPAGKADFVPSQKPDQWLASKFEGTDVIGTDSKSIGDVSDILFDKNGKIEAYVVSVGGFLGMSSKHVALAPSSFEVVRGQNGAPNKLRLSLNKDELKQAKNFTPCQPPHPATTTGMGMGSPAPSGGLTGGMRPSTNTPSGFSSVYATSMDSRVATRSSRTMCGLSGRAVGRPSYRWRIHQAMRR
jgi:sporulation protein YlmC with PRC-barrel domain